uniref:Polycomb protein suz12-like isoform X2 n=1 Tax=Crassostrea virginica TaxID=6565 RepID=A0A8B8CJH3_CRAVI|nr:polycomb protein suz12-like isoform X2 [Crassostrea virginica]
MKSKKRPRENTPAVDTQTETVDREQFLKAFEKPTQIYRYLRTRHQISPIILHRTLSYMKQRRSVSNAKRKSFDVNSILKRVTDQEKQKVSAKAERSKSLNLKIKGYFCENESNDRVDVDVFLIQVCSKRRGGSMTSVTKTLLRTVSVPVNPTKEEHHDPLLISHECFSNSHILPIKPLILCLCVNTSPMNSPMANGQCNGKLSSSDDEQPSRKKRNGQYPADDIEMPVFSTEVVILDRNKKCHVSSGDYEFVLHEQGADFKNASWETVMNGKHVQAFEVFNFHPTLKCSIDWTVNGKADSSTNSGATDATHMQYLSENQLMQLPLNSGTISKEEEQTTPKKRQRVFYQFLYNNSTRHQNEARDDLHCPWCALNCVHLYGLLKHLRLCHARFNFIYVPHPKGVRIDVTINERYDGSYAGNPQNLYSNVDIGYAFKRNGPVRRTPVTQVLVYRPKRPTESFTEFTEPESDIQINRQFMQGHNRLYYHTMTSEVIRPQEIDVDSEEETDPVWLRQKTVNMIDEFTDVNEGEKELMKLWNLHVMKYNFIADCQIPEACYSFVREHGVQMIKKNLFRNFLSHMVNLFDFSLIRPDVVHKTMQMLDEVDDSMHRS